MFLVFEGPDGSGTSTQAELLTRALQKKGLSVLKTAEPSSGILGKEIRKILQHEYALHSAAFQLLFFADREEHLMKEIIPALEAGKVVICERYVWSSIAYGVASGVVQNRLEQLAEHCLKPDYTFFCNVPPEVSLSRIEQRGNPTELFETEKTLGTVQECMTELAERCAFTKRASVLDATESKEQILGRIEMLLAPLLFARYFEPQ
ncbi:MAG: dTMP kinase [Candidatus Peregrinibacteria bacterium]